MLSAALPHDEDLRLQCLRTLQILDTPPEPALDAITALLSERLGCPITLLTLVDEHRQWFKSRHGLAVDETPREEAFCAHAILEERQFVVADALKDARFVDNPLVTGDTRIRFYAGQPLLVDGHAVGTLCVIDHAPREWTLEQATLLSRMATVVEALLGAQWRHREAAVEAARLHDFARASSSLLWECGTDLKVTWVGPAAETLLGASARDCIGKPLFDGTPLDELGMPKAGGPSLHEALRASGPQGLNGAYEVSTPLGRQILGVNVTPVPGRAGRVIGWRGVARDVSASVLARRQRREAEAAETRRQEQMDFLARVSHELRTPLNAILSFNRLLRDDVGSSGPAHRARWLDLVQAGGSHLLALTDDLITLCVRDRAPLALEAVDLAGTLSECAGLLAPSAADAQVRLELPLAMKMYVQADPRALRQVLFNVLSNAIKYSPPGGRVTVCCLLDEGHGILEVSDEGPGIPQDRLDRLFTPFERLGAEHSSVPGTGLGLAIAKTLVEGMHGEISAESPARGGCRIRLALPLGVPAAVKAGVAA